ncbi:flagellar protein FlaG [Shewanella sp. WXL01]|uniref:Flagellar protein FlaG n=1 Tax=Shewanella maritima TaxID=2520507 RepID=A0A411PDY0_9GAMM|nr:MULTISPECIES: flagellar protein FlaG [Shewanella]NKF50212.1 flagellar protein FlaG [Shewanella sp. WXL01]QBF81753.1 flagellar protein FlaG [Shewanella maritima]
MEIQQNTAASFITQAESNKAELNKQPLSAEDKATPTELTRTSSIQAVKQAEKAKEGEDKQQEQEELTQVADDLTEMVSMMQKGLKFSVDKDSGEQVIKVQDIESGDVIRQIPSEEALRLAEKLSEVSGILMKIEA